MPAHASATLSDVVLLKAKHISGAIRTGDIGQWLVAR